MANVRSPPQGECVRCGPPGTAAEMTETTVYADGHSPASRQGASFSKYSGAIRLSSDWKSRTKGRRDTSTKDCGNTEGSQLQMSPLRLKVLW
jgi:hypothetical protein